MIDRNAEKKIIDKTDESVHSYNQTQAAAKAAQAQALAILELAKAVDRLAEAHAAQVSEVPLCNVCEERPILPGHYLCQECRG